MDKLAMLLDSEELTFTVGRLNRLAGELEDQAGILRRAATTINLLVDRLKSLNK